MGFDADGGEGVRSEAVCPACPNNPSGGIQHAQAFPLGVDHHQAIAQGEGGPAPLGGRGVSPHFTSQRRRWTGPTILML